jgi:hypothetical protein
MATESDSKHMRYKIQKLYYVWVNGWYECGKWIEKENPGTKFQYYQETYMNKVSRFLKKGIELTNQEQNEMLEKVERIIAEIEPPEGVLD